MKTGREFVGLTLAFKPLSIAILVAGLLIELPAMLRQGSSVWCRGRHPNRLGQGCPAPKTAVFPVRISSARHNC